MIAVRRNRRRSLIHSKAMARNLSPRDGVAIYQRDSSSEFEYATTVSSYTVSASRPEMSMYLRQLTTLHAAGILTDEEFSAARGRLLKA